MATKENFMTPVSHKFIDMTSDKSLNDAQSEGKE